MTNEDEIRSMSDKQLAAFLFSLREFKDESIILEGQPFFSHKEIMEWLKENKNGK